MDFKNPEWQSVTGHLYWQQSPSLGPASYYAANQAGGFDGGTGRIVGGLARSANRMAMVLRSP
jgi:hypothetical protein